MKSRCRMPDTLDTKDGAQRKVGVEIELSGLGYNELLILCSRLLGGDSHRTSRYVSEIRTDLGPFTVELDSAPVKELDLQDDRLPQSVRDLGGHAMGVIDAAAEKIVPLEIISPPLSFAQLDRVEMLCDGLAEAGARGTREAIYYAFGLQLNPELPDLEPTTLLRYLRAFAALYEWLKARHQVDISRKLTTYIEPWSSAYIDLLIADDYAPDMKQLMKDYLHHNPTRNKALDLLPLFAHIDKELLFRYVDDVRVKSRPTLHYRLPDCDIDNSTWHFSNVWNDWVVLEQLVANAPDLDALSRVFRESRKLNLRNLTQNWVETINQWLRQRDYV